MGDWSWLSELLLAVWFWVVTIAKAAWLWLNVGFWPVWVTIIAIVGGLIWRNRNRIW